MSEKKMMPEWQKIKDKVDSVPWDYIAARQMVYKATTRISSFGYTLIAGTIIYMAGCNAYERIQCHEYLVSIPLCIGGVAMIIAKLVIRKFHLWEIKIKETLPNKPTKHV